MQQVPSIVLGYSCRRIVPPFREVQVLTQLFMVLSGLLNVTAMWSLSDIGGFQAMSPLPCTPTSWLVGHPQHLSCSAPAAAGATGQWWVEGT